MSESKIISLDDHREERGNEAAFLDLLDHDMINRADSVQPIPRDLLNRMDALMARADENRRRELLKG